MAIEGRGRVTTRIRKRGSRKDIYTTFRKQTGHCEKCGSSMLTHSRCEACHCLCGSGHYEGEPALYREHYICRSCFYMWRRLERRLEEEATWERFIKGDDDVEDELTVE